MNRLAFMLGLAALPAILILLWVRRLDSKRPEPLGLIFRSVVYGFLAVIPAMALELGLGFVLPSLPGLGDVLLKAFATAALVEESVKYFFLRGYLWRRPEFDERVDGIVYAVCVSMGFAFVENFMYGHDSVLVLALRAFTAVPGHAIFTGVMGYYLGKAKLDPRSRGQSYLGLLWAILLHGCYDAFLMTGGWTSFLVVPLLVAGGLALRGLFAKALAADNAAAER